MFPILNRTYYKDRAVSFVKKYEEISRGGYSILLIEPDLYDDVVELLV